MFNYLEKGKAFVCGLYVIFNGIPPKINIIWLLKCINSVNQKVIKLVPNKMDHQSKCHDQEC